MHDYRHELLTRRKMIYYTDEHVTVRGLKESDAEYFASEERTQGWNSTREKYDMRLRHQAEGRCLALVADLDGVPAGYINLYFSMSEGPFAGSEWPEIVDFGVLQKFQKRGIGTILMDAAERLAAERSDTVCLAVGLHNGYGSAQRMYAKRGYIPDGTGAWYAGKPCTPYDSVCTVDDDLVIFMSKQLKSEAVTRFESENIRYVDVTELLTDDYLTMVNDLENVGRFISRRTEPVTRAEELGWIHGVITEKPPLFSMIEKQTGEFIGNIELRAPDGTCAELGISITAAKQERGFGKEAIAAILGYGRRELGLKRVFLKVYPENARAIHVYGKCGFSEYDRTEDEIFMEQEL
ncbi:MAG: GNAT family N-acetyltransferase [Ruminococcus sp.]|nr:GNAT family N-acetyltransferase [Ruminococcus sp.]